MKKERASFKNGYVEGWETATRTLKGMLDKGHHGNKAALRLFSHCEDQLRPWAKSDTDQPAPECPTDWQDPPEVDDTASVMTNIK